MVITEVKCYELRIPTVPFKRRQGLPDFPANKNAVLLQIICSDGTEGLCLWDRNGAVVKAIVENQLGPQLKGQDPTRIGRIWELLWNLSRSYYFPKYVIGLVDIALWDLWAKHLGLPVARLAGGYRDGIPAYASTLSYRSLEEYKPVIDKALADGYRALKLHGPGRPEADLPLCRTVRDWVGPEFPLMFDATSDYSYEEALMVGRELEKLDYQWFEEPLKDVHRDQLRRLSDKLDIPLLIAESSDESFYDVANQISAATGTMIHGDPFIKGGITGVLKSAAICEAFGLTYQVHHSESYGLHAACAIRNTVWYEQIVPETTLQFDIERDLVRVNRDGVMQIPDRPGFGVEIDFDKLAKYVV